MTHNEQLHEAHGPYTLTYDASAFDQYYYPKGKLEAALLMIGKSSLVYLMIYAAGCSVAIVYFPRATASVMFILMGGLGAVAALLSIASGLFKFGKYYRIIESIKQRAKGASPVNFELVDGYFNYRSREETMQHRLADITALQITQGAITLQFSDGGQVLLPRGCFPEGNFGEVTKFLEMYRGVGNIIV